MENVIMKVQVREGTGKGAARKLRASGKVPGVLYGQGMKSLPLMADEKELWDLVNSISIENTLVDLMVEGYRKKPLKTIIREVQLHHYKSRIVHVDFFQVSLKKKIYVEIPLILMIGDSVRVKDVSVANAEILNDPEQPIATVIPPTVMKEPEPAVAAAAEGEEAEEGEAAPEEAEGEKEAAEEASADTEKE
jgi:large subunit ribosomal protein L25